MKTGAWAGVFLFLGVATVQSEEPFLILSGAGGGSIEIGQRICSDDDLYFHHDGSFELGIGWEYLGVAPPYDGAFGEAYELGPGAVNCVSLWLSEGGDWYTGQTTDVYVWEGGVAGSPGNVLAMVGGIVFQDIPVWPDGARFDVEIAIAVSGAFTAGSWGNWPGAGPGYAWLVDRDGPAGHPWTHVAEGTGVPPGWQHPNVAFGQVQSMGIGVHFIAGGTAIEPVTWSKVKRLFCVTR